MFIDAKRTSPEPGLRIESFRYQSVVSPLIAQRQKKREPQSSKSQKSGRRENLRDSAATLLGSEGQNRQRGEDACTEQNQAVLNQRRKKQSHVQRPR